MALTTFYCSVCNNLGLRDVVGARGSLKVGIMCVFLLTKQLVCGIIIIVRNCMLFGRIRLSEIDF